MCSWYCEKFPEFFLSLFNLFHVFFFFCFYVNNACILNWCGKALLWNVDVSDYAHILDEYMCVCMCWRCIIMAARYRDMYVNSRCALMCVRICFQPHLHTLTTLESHTHCVPRRRDAPGRFSSTLTTTRNIQLHASNKNLFTNHKMWGILSFVLLIYQSKWSDSRKMF